MRNLKSVLAVVLGIAILSLTYSCKKNHITPASPPIIPPLVNLVAHWELNGDATDASRYGNDGLTFYTTPVADRFGNANSALEFNGANSFILVPDSVRLRLEGYFTLNAWVKMKAFNPSYASAIVSKRVTGTNNGWFWAVNGVGNEYLGPLGSVYYGPGGGSSNARRCHINKFKSMDDDNLCL